ncbi:hypothetical protein RJ640_013254 [Escallonia rubra]|uniref:dihydroneopterin aldolase n=1 Tax=Escallonia rubra TaxID=112253 RepID=A0AA88UCH5_9ASTE|nr:hypothetical protein RJ640_013254 [Escallonia rubra]
MTEEGDAIKGDKLVLRGLKFHGYHGVKLEERKLGQKFLIDVDAWMDLRAAGKSDNLLDTVSYTEIYRLAFGPLFALKYSSYPSSHISNSSKLELISLLMYTICDCMIILCVGLKWNGSIVREVVEGPPQNLLESVAQLIASTTLANCQQISAVRVKVGKPHVAVQGPVDYLGVEIIRYRSIDAKS